MKSNDDQSTKTTEDGPSESHQTRRTTVPALEKLLQEPIPVLDHGFVRVVDYMGDDSAVVQAARASACCRRRMPREIS